MESLSVDDMEANMTDTSSEPPSTPDPPQNTEQNPLAKSVEIKKRKLNRYGLFYKAKLFLPGFFEKSLFLMLGILLPFLDYVTDYYNGGL